ncbi:MAG: hypothetical protein N2484_00870 [Clostridia bacterium]|nr:hypothetical protein [Clostridia bacterium]
MSEITVDLGKEIDQHDLTVLRKNLEGLGDGDKIIIRMEAADAHEAGKVTDELVRQGFDYQPHGGHGVDFYFTAVKTGR